MGESKNLDASSNSNIKAVTYDIYPAPDEFCDGYGYHELYYDSMCMSCQYWDGYVCNVKNINCNYEPF